MSSPSDSPASGRQHKRPFSDNNAEAPLILIVEDNASLRALLVRELEDNGHRAVEAGLAAEAEKQLQSGEDHPHLILLDLHLPDLSDGPLLQKIMKLAPDVPVIVITGSGDIASAVEMMKLGARDYLAKDFSLIKKLPLVVQRTLSEVKREQSLRLAEIASREQLKRQKAIAALGIRAVSMTDLRELFDAANHLIVEVVGVEFAKLQELLPGGTHFRLRAGVGWKPGEIGSNCVSAGPETPAGLALHLGKPVIVENLAKDPRFSPPVLFKDHGIVSGVTVLIHGPAGPFGVLGMHSTDTRTFSRIDVDFLQALANILAAALGRMQVEETLRKKEIFCSTMTETMGAMVITLDRAGRIIQFNRACQQLTGYTFDEVAGRRLWDFLVPEAEREAVEGVGTRLKAGECCVEFENHWLTKKGESRLISWTNSIIAQDNGEIDRVISTGIDITDRKNLERELLRAADHEREELGRELHDDLCQYLSGITMMVESLGISLGKLNLPEYREKAQDIAEHAKEALEHTRLLAHGLAPLQSKTGSMAGSFTELAVYIEKAFRVKCWCFLPPGAELGNAATNLHLFRITQEAAHNAVRHGAPKNIEIAARLQADNAMVFTISDDGKGFTTRSVGTGIRNMERRATLIGGELKISSNPGEGTTVTCLIPSLGPRIPRQTSAKPGPRIKE